MLGQKTLMKFKSWFSSPLELTSDELLMEDIKAAIKTLASLSTEAYDRGIDVMLKTNTNFDICFAKNIQLFRASKTNVVSF